ncbi:MAG TPA: hypothetical protein VGK04_12030 [Thermoanaerobaculia bacterium]
MPFTVWGAFDKFREDIVDLPPAQTKSGRVSRDYLSEQIKKLPSRYPWFPRLIGTHVPYGSFARSVKTRPLDDIDLLILLVGTGTEIARGSDDPYTLWIKILNSTAPLAMFPDQFGYVNSTKVLNAFKSALSDVPAYAKSDVSKNGEAVTLSLSSYPWAFDAVPAVPVNDGAGGFLYYVIPNGSGDWLATDPRRDAAQLTAVNQGHYGELLPVVRLLKYWNRRVHKPRLSSYYFETLVKRTFEFQPPIGSSSAAMRHFFANAGTYVWLSCPDPKGLGPNLDADISYETKKKVTDAMSEAARFASNADLMEGVGDQKSAIYWWGRVFGTDFPSYG